eukprot:TRINITY_DN440_c0_g1_i2.p1 TRINITY_DN440_c0_g1~~TRINITY_DN440_c0_g1_i2.p1  ORF type:complete len:690 (-),score=233.25 TRINITY_DN440_c0_g1_i2:349-2268(-)
MAENVPKTDIPLDIETETGDVSQTKAAVKRKSRNCGNVRRSWEDRKEVQGEVPASSACVPTMEMLKEAALRQRTPERKALRQAVAKTIESVSNSPKLLLTKRLPRPGKGGSLVLSLKAGSSSRRLSAGGSTTSKKEGSSATRSMLRKNPAAVGSGRARGPLKATSGLVKTAETQEILKSSQPSNRGRTLVRPRNSSCGPSMSSRSRDSSKEGPSKYVSTAEAIMNMQRCTPERFRSVPMNAPKARSRSISPGAAAFRITQPRSPQLMTRCRSRPTHILSSEEQMNIELQEIRKHQFKARAVGEGVKPCKLREVELRPGTIPVPFKLSESRRRHVSTEDLYTEPAFKANPVPKNILAHATGIPKKKPLLPVAPSSPHLSTKDRVKSKEKLNKNKQNDSTESINSVSSDTFKARPAPHFGVPTTLPPQPKKNTVVQPFSFNDKIAQADLRKKEKISEILEKEKKEREFKAHPLPNFTKPINLPIKEHILPTKVEPFNLDIEKRVEARLKKWEESIEEESKKQKEAATFKARPAKLGVPFVPAPSNKPLVEISNFELHTDRRAVEREAFEMQKKEKEVEIQEYKRLREDQIKLKEEEEVRRLRKEAVHKSNPIRKYPPIIIHPSDKPVTEPKSPNFVLKKNN